MTCFKLSVQQSFKKIPFKTPYPYPQILISRLKKRFYAVLEPVSGVFRELFFCLFLFVTLRVGSIMCIKH